MTEHTTIQITKAQAEQLQDRKTHSDESYKSVIARLLEGDNSAIDTTDLEAKVSETASVVESLERRIDDLESQLPAKVAEGLR